MGSSLDKILALTPETAEASTVPKPIHPDGPGLWKHKHMEAPPYVQHVAQALMKEGHSESDAYHMAVGIIKSWAAGHNGKHKTHPDVRAAAAANVARWEELRGQAKAETAAKHAAGKDKKGHDLAASADLPVSVLRLMEEWAQSADPGPWMPLAGTVQPGTAPGARPLVGRLWQAPSQTVSPSPPLPPGVALPSPSELDSFGQTLRETDPDSDLLRGASGQAHAAAQKLRAKQPNDALRLLRGIQAGINSAHREFNASQIPVANVFSASLIPAEQSSAQSAMYEGLAARNKFRALSTQAAQYVDRIRRVHFHGMYGGLAQARFSAEGGPLDHLLALANGVTASTGMIYVQVPHGQIPDGIDPSIDKPGHITVAYLGSISDAAFQQACDRTRAVAKAMCPVHGIMGGVGLFNPANTPSGKQVAYVPVHAQGLHALHEMLSDLCPDDTMPFRPHVTLAYQEPGTDVPAPTTSTRVCFSQLHVARGDQECSFALTGHGGHSYSHTGMRPLVAPRRV